MNIPNKFFFGSLSGMDRPSFKWWNGKRLEYNVRFIGCLLTAQVLFAITAFSLADDGPAHLLSSLPNMLSADLVLLVLINLLYFLWPILDLAVSSKRIAVFRKYCFAFINLLSAMIVVAALIVTSIATQQ